jgi:hypothetical protein
MASITNIIRSLVFVAMILLIISVQVNESQISVACSTLCSQFWTCIIRNWLESNSCVEPPDCNCREFEWGQ